MAFILLLLCLASVAGVAGILWMLFGPASTLFAPPSPLRVSYAGMNGFVRAPSDFSFEEHVHVETPIVQVARPIAPPLPDPDVTSLDAPIVELPQVEPVKVAAKIPSLPKVAQAVALPAVPRLGVARKALPPLPARTARGTTTPPTSGKLRPSAFATDQVTVSRDPDTFGGDVEHTIVE